MHYRREVDGLRAIAVVSVILFHAGAFPFTGGFVGVDVFFVISGHLITSIILRDTSEGKFSLSLFYQRRIRRILPALFAVTLTSSAVGYWFLKPDLFKYFSQSLVALSLFSSNISFWRETGYFAATAEEKPLLHTWSLSVEEQFYVIFPILLIFLLTNRRNRAFSIIAACMMASLLTAELGSRYFPAANFFLLPGRIWELLAGSLIAFYWQRNKPKPNGWLASLGLTMLLVSIVYFDKQTPFPSFYSSVPILGTCLIILFCNGQDFTGRVLSASPVVAIGLISYSLYLWHQPVLAFARVLSLEPLTHWMTFSAVSLSFLLGYLSWRFVEKPFRNPKSIYKGNSCPFIATGLITGVMLGFGVWGHVTQGAPGRFPVELQRQFAAAEDPGLSEYGCVQRIEKGITVCGFGDWETARHSVLLIGNSHARMFIPELHREFSQAKIRGVHSRYSFQSDDLALENSAPREVSRWKEDISSLVDTSDAIVVSMRWTQGITAQLNYFDDKGIQNPPKTQDAITEMFLERLSWLSKLGKPLYLVMPVPEAPVNVPKQMLLEARLPMLEVERDSPKDVYYLKNEKAINLLKTIARKFANVTLVDPSDDLCSSHNCNLYIGNLPAYYDDNHLSSEGAKATSIRLTKSILTTVNTQQAH